MPHPETAVNAAAFSIVSRMKRRSSSARPCRDGTRSAPDRVMSPISSTTSPLSSALHYKVTALTASFCLMRTARPKRPRTARGIGGEASELLPIHALEKRLRRHSLHDAKDASTYLQLRHDCDVRLSPLSRRNHLEGRDGASLHIALDEDTPRTGLLNVGMYRPRGAERGYVEADPRASPDSSLLYLDVPEIRRRHDVWMPFGVVGDDRIDLARRRGDAARFADDERGHGRLCRVCELVIVGTHGIFP